MADFKAFQGLRNDVSAERFAPADLEVATNVNLDNSGKLLSRDGYVKKITAAVHSLWAHGDICLYVQGANLKRLNSDLVSSVTVRSDLSSGLVMSYDEVDSKIYYSNGTQTGIYSSNGNRTWGIVPPVFQPLATNAYGDMFAGTYQYALTYLREDGQESGTGIADKIQITTGAITFSDIPVSPDPTVTHKVIYLTEANGEVLYRALVLTNETTSANYNGGIVRTPLDTQFCQHAPAGQLVRYFQGRMYVAQNQWLFYSKGYGYELFDLRDYFGFTSAITMLAPVQDGLFIGTETETYFLAGTQPDQMQLISKSNVGVVKGALTYVASNQVKGLDNVAKQSVPVWTSHSGIVVGISGGTIIDLTLDRYTIGKANEGAALFRTVNGIDQYITVLRS